MVLKGWLGLEKVGVPGFLASFPKDFSLTFDHPAGSFSIPGGLFTRIRVERIRVGRTPVDRMPVERVLKSGALVNEGVSSSSAEYDAGRACRGGS